MAGPPRYGAIVIVTLLSCLVLGAVWGVVLTLLPHSDGDAESVSSVAPSSSPPPMPVSQPPSVPQAAALSAPAPVNVAPPAPTVAAQPMSVPAPRPFGMDLKCAMEVDGLCAEEPGDRRLCLQRNAQRVSEPCRSTLRERVSAMKTRLQQLRAACDADRRQFCREAPLQGEVDVRCLEEHAQDVSDRCFQLLPKQGQRLN